MHIKIQNLVLYTIRSYDLYLEKCYPLSKNGIKKSIFLHPKLTKYDTLSFMNVQSFFYYSKWKDAFSTPEWENTDTSTFLKNTSIIKLMHDF